MYTNIELINKFNQEIESLYAFIFSKTIEILEHNLAPIYNSFDRSNNMNNEDYISQLDDLIKELSNIKNSLISDDEITSFDAINFLKDANAIREKSLDLISNNMYNTQESNNDVKKNKYNNFVKDKTSMYYKD
ncbi:hypothetical protein CHL78_019600 [Romboutsia weinsteinii]|uniref:Uncharacterized protein n=1 Tax=Romboutsia weinsteinii TaxID=2020949 RepID=A0A371IXG5_9FIRM|nr:hypothetical protein [Romboutsia weinsteinii]RDY25170.1 hypothetical protein CHL78_019600 [Romboutsia weinsteinii]